MHRRLAPLLAALILAPLAALPLLVPAAAQASQTSRFVVRSALAGNGQTKSAGSIRWMGAKSAQMNLTTTDICPDDAWVARTIVTAKFARKTIRTNQHDTNGCGNGGYVGLLDLGPGYGKLRSIQVYACELKGSTGEVRDCRSKTYRNPYLG